MSEDDKTNEVLSKALGFRVTNAEAQEMRERAQANVRALASSLMPSAEVLRGFANLGEQMRRARADIARSVAAFYPPKIHIGAAVVESVRAFQTQAAEAVAAWARYLEGMPEGEREEMRRALEDAPLEPVDINAPGVM